MKKPISLLCMLLCILILPACSSFNGGGTDREIGDVEVHSGDEGLVMEFAEDSPPETVQENQEFPVSVNVENRGAYNITDGYISLIYEDEYVDIEGWSAFTPITTTFVRFSLPGKTTTNPEGGKQFFTLDLESEELKDIEETHTVALAFNGCYPYKTYFAETACIDTSLSGQDERKKSCEVGDVSAADQGAPVAVTSIEPHMRANQNGATPQYTITIENVGDGKVVSSSKVREACSASGIEWDEFNTVNITSAYLSDNALDCTPREVKLEDQEATVRCESEATIPPSRGTFSTNIYLKLSYGYTTTLSERIEIRKITRP